MVFLIIFVPSTTCLQLRRFNKCEAEYIWIVQFNGFLNILYKSLFTVNHLTWLRPHKLNQPESTAEFYGHIEGKIYFESKV